MTEGPISKRFSKRISKVTFDMVDQITAIGQELCPLKEGQNSDLPVVFSFGLLAWELMPESRFKVREFCGGALYVFKTDWVMKEYSTQLWDFYFHDVQTWQMLLYYAELHKLNPSKSPIQTVERRMIQSKYETWPMK
jgi:hypothetical protein